MTDDRSLHWRGINHLALVTTDMDATVRFYHGALGMPVVATINAGPMRHYFFDMGAGNTIAFFQWSDADIETFEKPAGIPPEGPVQFDMDPAMPVREMLPGMGHAIELRVYRTSGLLHLDWWFDTRRLEPATVAE